MNLSDKQLIHRAYLGSPLWEKKRIEALEYHGAICARCGSHGTDVHHKTYARTGGQELMTDLEVLCRPCHETHHRVERATRSRSVRNRGINVTALARYLTPNQREVITKKHGLTWPQIYSAIISMDNRSIMRDALCMVGKDYAFQHKRRGTGNARESGRWAERHRAKMM